MALKHSEELAHDLANLIVTLRYPRLLQVFVYQTTHDRLQSQCGRRNVGTSESFWQLADSEGLLEHLFEIVGEVPSRAHDPAVNIGLGFAPLRFLQEDSQRTTRAGVSQGLQ